MVVSAFHFIDLSRPELVWYEVAAVPDAKTKIVLPDSSTVWLNANARLVYPRSFEDVNRKVSISGEAFFQVRKDKNHPFIVDIGKISAKVLSSKLNFPVIHDMTLSMRIGEIIISPFDGEYLASWLNAPTSPNVIVNRQPTTTAKYQIFNIQKYE